MTNRPTSGVRTLITPREAMRRLGVTRKTLLRYEDAGQLVPVKLPSGHRRYRDEDVQAIERGEVMA